MKDLKSINENIKQIKTGEIIEVPDYNNEQGL